MGAGSSNNIKTIKIDQHDSDSTKNDDGFGIQKSILEHSQSPTASVQTASVERPDSGKYSARLSNRGDIDSLTRQLCESESVRLDLEDRIQALEEQLAEARAENIAQEERPCDETLHAKDQFIAKLEKEKTEIQTECQKMKVRHRKKLKQLNTQMAEYKQEVNFQMMELQEEIEKLKQKNSEKLPKNEKAPAYASIGDGKSKSGVDSMASSESKAGGDKMKLILELSEQVADQQDKIAALESTVRARDTTIDELRKKMKNNSDYLKAINSARDSPQLEQTGGNRNKNNNSGKRLSKHSSFTSTQSKSQHVSDAAKIDALFSYGEEESDEDGGSLNKLSSLLKGVKSSAKKPNSSLDLPHDTLDSDRHASIGGSTPGDEQDASNGRDSGLGSAGKRDEQLLNGKRITALSDWRDHVPSFESGSGLSDSDMEPLYHSAGKISSAPAKMRNIEGKKLKKKSNSLRNRSKAIGEVADKPPRPSMAFMKPVHEEDFGLPSVGRSPVSKQISPIEVS
ncbi:uncharacterized protein LOC127851359 [Dreissena polymorpha]|uniref:Uncharacterized protein n=1 Tax=Dreissena polymorpha TaxID=45954 RepID=A0A9D4DAB4_DREPO|nr:uncharacterized protein LOC127851359 [Dreissena polymorpha]KAH3741465.1 hypothetical protein DPMN_048190 [Dreissena polymorpha]